MTIADEAVLVTGANRGIGPALAAEALSRGAKRVYAGIALYDDLSDRAVLERPTPCRRPWPRAGAAARPRRSSARTRRSHKQRPSRHEQREGR